jgi:aryl-alcohol dehydrogenase-like predicted oxidoreductase
MEYRQIGTSDLQASVIGTGGYPFGPPLLDQADTTRVVDAAIDAGINFFDTSDVYGGGQSEVQLGVALTGKRQNVILATKFNFIGLGAQTARERIVGRCEEALRKLQTDYIDLYQVHHSSPHVAHEELLEPLNDLVREGKVRHIGNSNTASWRWHEELIVSRTHGWAEFASTQNHFSLLYRHAEVELMPFCRAYGRSLLAYFPLGGGWLTGTYRPGEPPPPGTRASKVPTGIVTRLRSPRVDALVPQLEAFARDRGHTLAELALAWVLAHPEVAVALTGFDRPQHVAANVKAVNWKLSTDELSQVDAITNWWDGGNAVIDNDGPPLRPQGA